MNKKVSVIIPCYNIEKYVSECLESVYHQTYSNLEVLLINDGSKDRTEEILMEYVNKYPNITKYIYQNNSGPSVARNLGIKNSEGEYICFMDSDDILFPESIEKRVNILDMNSDVYLVCSDSYMIQENSFTKDKLSSLLGEVYSGNIFKELLKKNFISTQTVLMRREIIKSIGFFNESYLRSEDYEYWLRIANKYKITFIKEPLAYTRVRNGSLSTNKKNEMEDSLISVYQSVFESYNLTNEEKKVLKKRQNDIIYYLNLRLANDYFQSRKFLETRKCLKKVIKSRKRIKHVLIYLLCSVFPELLYRFYKFYFHNFVKSR